jgi:hypothetical protein
MTALKVDHKLISEWKKLRDTYLDKGLSKKQTYQIIATDYHTTPDSVRWHLDYKERSAKYRKAYWNRIEDFSHRYEKKAHNKSYLFELIRLFEDVFQERDFLTPEEAFETLLRSKDTPEYSKTFKRFFSLLPLTEVEKDKYRMLK